MNQSHKLHDIEAKMAKLEADKRELEQMRKDARFASSFRKMIIKTEVN